MLTTRVGPKLEVGGACTSVAFDLGDLDGRYPDLAERWAVREKLLTQHIDWQAFKANYDEVAINNVSRDLLHPSHDRLQRIT